MNNMFIEIFKQKQENPMLNKYHKFDFLKIIIIIPNDHSLLMKKIFTYIFINGNHNYYSFRISHIIVFSYRTKRLFNKHS